MSFWNRKKKNEEVEYWRHKYERADKLYRELRKNNPYIEKNMRLLELNDNLNEYCMALEKEVHTLKAKAYSYDKLMDGKDIRLSKVGVRISDLDETIQFLTDLKRDLLENMKIDKD